MSSCRTALRRAGRALLQTSSPCSTPIPSRQIASPLQGLASSYPPFQTEALPLADLRPIARCITSIRNTLLDDALARQAFNSVSPSTCIRTSLYESPGSSLEGGGFRGFSSGALEKLPAASGTQPPLAPPRPESSVAQSTVVVAGQVAAGQVEATARTSGTQPGAQGIQAAQSSLLSAELRSPQSSHLAPPPSPTRTAAASVVLQETAAPLPSFSRQPSKSIPFMRQMSIVTASANNRKSFMVDTLALVRRLEAEGMNPKQAEAITHVITDVLHESLESAARTFVANSDMQKMELVHEAGMSRMRTELQSSSDIRLAGIQREVEGLRTDLDKLKSELRYEVDKVTSGQRLDLNLEKGRVKEELNLFAQETSNLSNKLDREVNSLKAALEAAKFDVIRYCVGTLVSVSAVGLGMLRILM